MTSFDAAFHEIGAKGHLSNATAREAAERYCKVLTTYPDIPQHMLCIAGYDDDTRELWDIPEVRKFVKDFAGWIVLILGLRPLSTWRLDEASLGLILVCTGLGEIDGRDPATGNWVIKTRVAPPPRH